MTFKLKRCRGLSQLGATLMTALAIPYSVAASSADSPDAGPGCEASRVALQVLGSGGPELDDKRASSGYLVWLDGKARLLVDIGSGSMLNFERSGARIEDLQAVLISHLHVDHSGDLPALVKAAYFTPRQQDLPVYGPDGNYLMPSTTDWLARLFASDGSYRYLSEYLQPEQRSDFKLIPHTVASKPREISRFPINDQIIASAVPTHHGPVPSLGWRVELAGCRLTFSGDMSNHYGTLTGLATGSNILVAHNAVPVGAKGAARSLHMTPAEIAAIAADSASRLLVLSHRMKRTLGREEDTLSSIRARYNGDIRFADDMQRFIPLEE